MMKHLKKIMALAIALIMCMMMSATAFASTITINSTSTDDGTNTTEYTYYQILKADLSGLEESDYNADGSPKDDAKVVYYVEDATLAAALPSSIFNVTSVTGATPARWNVELKGSPSAQDIINAVNVDAVKNAATSSTFNMSGTSATATVDPGYYLILSSNGTNAIIQTLADVTIDEKNTYPTVDKKITGENGSNITETTSNDVNIGDTVTYTVPVTIPANAAEKAITLTDKMYKGLTLNTSSLSDDKSLGLSFAGPTTDGDYNIYTITIPATSVTALKGQTVTFTYSATLNADAAINGDNKNTIKLTYDNYTTTEHEVTTKTHKVEINKVTEDGTTKLAGVKFTLTNSDSKYYVTKNGDSSVWQVASNEFTTDGTNNIVFDGLDAGTYTLTETDTPDGYNKLTAPITVVVAEDGSVTYTSTDPHNTADGETATDGVITIVNQSGATLPSTGGIGTTIFYVIGAVLVIGAGVLLVTRRRMRAE